MSDKPAIPTIASSLYSIIQMAQAINSEQLLKLSERDALDLQKELHEIDMWITSVNATLHYDLEDM